MSQLRERITGIVKTDLLNFHKQLLEAEKGVKNHYEDTCDFLDALYAQVSYSTSGPLIPKTPKTLRKRGVKKEREIETIFEDEDVMSETIEKQSVNETAKENELQTTRSKRQASKRATTTMKNQYEEWNSAEKKQLVIKQETSISEQPKKTRELRSKRPKSHQSSSDEEDRRPSKHSKMEVTISYNGNCENSKIDTEHILSNDNTLIENKESNSELQKCENTVKSSLDNNKESHYNNKMDITQVIRKQSLRNQPVVKIERISTDQTLDVPVMDDIEEPSLYEDAIGKSVPIMNSTMIVDKKMMNTTVVIEPINNKPAMNETVIISKQLSENRNSNQRTSSNSYNLRHSNTKHNNTIEMKRSNSALDNGKKLSSRETLQDRSEESKTTVPQNMMDLMTDDESSPECKKSKRTAGKRKLENSGLSSDEEGFKIPPKKAFDKIAAILPSDSKIVHKPNVLFSPYAKDSVKKKVEAFEQAVMSSPKSIDMNAPTRITRTKTRAMAAVAAAAETQKNDAESVQKNIVQKLARKSLARAKKISIAKDLKDGEDTKENSILHNNSKLLQNEKLLYKQQLKTTPISKSKILLPVSVNRIYQTPVNTVSYTKTMTAPRSNIVTSVDSFIPALKSTSKRQSIDKSEERKKKINDEDARKKKDDALRLMTEEKRRKREEKELKNRLAREAKERRDMEKRLKAEKEREERAKMALILQEKQREELEKKRLAQLLRNQEKEERRRQEEQQRLLKLQEQEEQERLLAEQRRKEQENEKRKDAELRAQQQAAAEAVRIQNQMLAAQLKHGQQNSQNKQGPTNYVLDSDPDDDESDDENQPKHEIPQWAKPSVRKHQLITQQYIPQQAIYAFFDTRKCTPDLTELFHGIDRSRLKRTSSAIWKTPPRYSMMNASK